MAAPMATVNKYYVFVPDKGRWAIPDEHKHTVASRIRYARKVGAVRIDKNDQYGVWKR